MAFRHGVYRAEVPTSIIAPAQSDAGIPVVIGTAPVFMANTANVNKPVLVHTYEEAVREFGYSDDWQNYTLCEFIYSQFALFGQSPAVLINVFDPAKHSKETAGASYTSSNGRINLGAGVISADKLTLSYDDEGNAFVPAASSSLTVNKIIRADPSKVTASDIIGGVNVSTGKLSGLELVNEVFPRFRLVPGIIAAPKWSTEPGVAAVMRAKAESVSGVFECICVTDIPCGSGGAKTYSDAPAWKNTKNYVSEREITCWPKVQLDGKVFHLSTQIVGALNRTDTANDDVPCKSPSNTLLQIDSCVNDDGTEILLSLEEANYLNSQGIMTAINWIGGWRAWGNRTAAYPANTDAKDNFIPVRRMFSWLGNQFVLTSWQKVDAPVTVRLIRTAVNSFNLYLNSLVAREMLLGARVEFREDENAFTDLLNGIIRFHMFITPPVPAEVIEGIFEYDPAYLSVLYSALTSSV